jgi:hypothetical protein
MKKITSKIVGFSVVPKGAIEAEAAAAAMADASTELGVVFDYDPTVEALDDAPMGVYDSKRYGVEYHHPLEGKQSLFLSASYFPAKGVVDGEDVIADRVFEVFMPGGQREDIQPWVTTVMKLSSLLLQQGVPVSRILKKFDTPGSLNIPFPLPSGKRRFFTSEVQVVGQAFKNLFHPMGVMDEEGRDIPFSVRAAPVNPGKVVTSSQDDVFDLQHSVGAAAVKNTNQDGDFPSHSTVCPKCGVKAVIPLDGCNTCLSCQDSKCG